MNFSLAFGGGFFYLIPQPPSPEGEGGFRELFYFFALMF
jgi:hypothetical protein